MEGHGVFEEGAEGAPTIESPARSADERSAQNP